MNRYVIAVWLLGIPFCETVEFQNDHQAIGFAFGILWKRHEPGSLQSLEDLNPVHVYRAPREQGETVQLSVATLVAAWIPDAQDGELGVRLNHPEGRGRAPQQWDVWIEKPPFT